MKRCFVLLLILAGCAAPQRVVEEKPVSTVVASSHPPREMLVYVPISDESAASWVRWFTKYPDLRMVIAVSPHFQHLSKDAHLKADLLALMKSGRLELAAQIPNAPILPLLMDTFSARDALPPAAILPNPSYAYPDDVIQLVAQVKSDFFRQWNFLPQGLVLPYGATSEKLHSLLAKLGFSWMIGALQAPAVDGPYQFSGLKIWDGAPLPNPSDTIVRVWDERMMKTKPLDGWVQDIRLKKKIFLLPSDNGIEPRPFSTVGHWKPGTWDHSDWSPWIGQSAKNDGWGALRKTREALEQYKNSGQASVQRLDVAFSDIYNAQNSNYFLSMGNTAQSPDLVEERQHDFQATLLAVYRFISHPPPDDLFQGNSSGNMATIRPSSTTTQVDVSLDGREHVMIRDAIGDTIGGSGGADLASLEVWSSTTTVLWSVTLATAPAASTFIDIYIDMNGQPNAGTPTFLPGRGFTTSSLDAWEYAIAIAGQTATLYRTQGMGTSTMVQTVPVMQEGTSLRVAIPVEIMHGSPRRWGYQVLVMNGAATKAAVSDFIDPFEISQKELWQDLSSGKRSDIPFIRVRSR